MNTVLSIRTVPPGEAQALEARFGLRVTARLNAGAETLPHDVSERLRIARQQAMAKAVQRQAAAKRSSAEAAQIVSVQMSSGHATLGWSGGPSMSRWKWLATALPVLVLLFGLFGIDQWQQFEQSAAAAEIDAALLGDDLPPSAFTDPAFAEFLLEPVVEAVPEFEPDAQAAAELETILEAAPEIEPAVETAPE